MLVFVLRGLISQIARFPPGVLLFLVSRIITKKRAGVAVGLGE
jgi:hypothetical protein